LPVPQKPLPLIMVEQIEYLASLDGPIDDATRRQVDEIKVAGRARHGGEGGVTGGPNILGAPPGYWADLNAYDPAATGREG